MIRRIAIAAAAVAVFAGTGGAQQSRAELLRSAQSAYDDFAPERALDLLKVAVNPALGPTDTAWVRGVHLLTQILVEANNQDLAKSWARWAVRVAPDMRVDTVNFLAGVVAAFREARAFTSARTAGDAVTRTSWRWVTRGSTETRGRIIAEAAGMPVAVNVRVVGGAIIPPGIGLALAPGSYEFEAAAPGYLPARLTRELLPGVTTVLTFSLTSAAVASDVIAEGLRQHSFANAGAVSVRRFGTPPACAAGAFVGRDGLWLTSYQAIRGADSFAASVPSSADIRVAAYDVAANLAVLRVGAVRTDSMLLAPNVADGQSAWAINFTDCRTAADSRVRVAQWIGRPAGTLQLTDPPAAGTAGAALVDVEGKIAGVWTGSTTAVPSLRIIPLLDAARRAVAQGQLTTIAEVSRKENHAYGTVVIASDMTGATARVTPLETWHWDGLQSSGNTPFAYAGPMGRYRVEVTGPGDVRRQQDVTIRPGAEERVFVALRSVATTVPGAPPASAPAKKKSKMPWILAGVGGAGLVGALALGGGGGGGGGGNPPPPPTTGSITLHVPVTVP